MSSDPSEYAISVASREDLPQLLALQKADLVANGGSLSIEFPSDWFERSMEEMPIIVAKRGGQLVGYLVPSSRTATRHLALPEAKFRAYPAAPDAYNSGPLCIASSDRGRGLAAMLLGALGARLPSREAATFIRRDNASSRAAHLKVGFQEVAEFSHAGVDYVVAVHAG
jgi:L-amino acid N-acyltransferase YncA